jgi:hypothetical protein
MKADAYLHLEPIFPYRGASRATGFRIAKATQNANVRPVSDKSRVVKVTVEISDQFFARALPHVLLTVPDPAGIEIPEMTGEALTNLVTAP